MMKALFLPGLLHRPDPAQVEQVLAQFAEALEEDLPLNAIADRLAITRGSACAYLKMLCDRLGCQAN